MITIVFVDMKSFYELYPHFRAYIVYLWIIFSYYGLNGLFTDYIL